jgi:hypothetical protein
MGEGRSRSDVPVPIGPRIVLLAEYPLRGPGDRIRDWVAGAEGRPSYLVRTIQSVAGGPSYILGVPAENAAAADAAAALAAAREDLARSGAREVFAGALGSDSVTRAALELLGFTPLATTETWWKAVR